MDSSVKKIMDVNYQTLHQKINYFCLLAMSLPYLTFFLLLSFKKEFLAQKVFHSPMTVGLFYGLFLIFLSVFLTALRCYFVKKEN